MSHLRTIEIARQRELLKLAWKAKTSKDAQEVLALLETLASGLKWRPVGDIEDNHGPIRASSDSALAMNERYTNALDAVLELAARQKYGDDFTKMAEEMSSPREAAANLLGVPEEGIHALTHNQRQDLADAVVMTFEESGVASRPTIVVTDQGIGITPEKVPHTILHLFRGNKKDKPWLSGLHGWGGSNTLGYSAYTIFVTRRHPDLLDGDEDGVAITVVKQVYEEGMGQPAYQYAVMDDGEVATLDPAVLDELESDFEHGVRVIHVEYDHSVAGALINQYNFFSGALFDPVAPVWLGSYRASEKHAGRRVISGVANRLRDLADGGKTDLAYASSTRIDLGEGEGHVTARLWVLDDEDAAPSDDLTGSYVAAEHGIVVTLNGQRQESQERSWLKREVGLSYLYKRTILQIVADDLHPLVKSEIFSTTREKMRNNEKGQRILTRVADWLKADDELQDLEEQLRQDALSHTAEKASEKDLDKLAKAIGKLGGRTKVVEVETDVEDRGTGTRKGKGGTRRSIDDSHLPDAPDELHFEVHDLEIHQGGTRRRLMVNINAKNGYLPDHEDDLTVTVVGPSGETRDVYPHNRSALRGGQAQWLVEAALDAELGEYKLTAALEVGEDTLTDTMKLTVLPQKEKGKSRRKKSGGKKKGKRKEERPAGPDVSYVTEEDWDKHGFTKASVGKVIPNPKAGGVDIVLNLHEERLREVIENPKLGEGQIKRRKSDYMIPVALGLYRHHELESSGVITEEQLEKLNQILAHSVLYAVDSKSLMEGDEDDV